MRHPGSLILLGALLSGCAAPERQAPPADPAPASVPAPEPQAPEPDAPPPEPPPPAPAPDDSSAPAPTGMDRTAPLVRILRPIEGAVLDEAPVEVLIEVSDDRGVASLTINDAQLGTSAGRYRARMSQPQRGLNQVFVEAWDTSGNKTRQVLTFSYLVDETPAPAPPPSDDVPPTIRVVGPPDGTHARAPIFAVVEVTDNHHVKRVRINGVEAAKLDRDRYRIAIHRPLQGQNLVRVLASDAAGNTSSAQWSFTFDATPPGVEANAWLVIQGRVDDVDARLEINGVAVPFDPQTGEYSARVPANAEHPERVTIVATDEFGNQTTEVRLLR